MLVATEGGSNELRSVWVVEAAWNAHFSTDSCRAAAGRDSAVTIAFPAWKSLSPRLPCGGARERSVPSTARVTRRAPRAPHFFTHPAGLAIPSPARPTLRQLRWISRAHLKRSKFENRETFLITHSVGSSISNYGQYLVYRRGGGDAFQGSGEKASSARWVVEEFYLIKRWDKDFDYLKGWNSFSKEVLLCMRMRSRYKRYRQCDALTARRYWSTSPPPDKIARAILRPTLRCNVPQLRAIEFVLRWIDIRRDDPSIVTCHWMSTEEFHYLFILCAI